MEGRRTGNIGDTEKIPQEDCKGNRTDTELRPKGKKGRQQGNGKETEGRQKGDRRETERETEGRRNAALLFTP